MYALTALYNLDGSSISSRLGYGGIFTGNLVHKSAHFGIISARKCAYKKLARFL